MTWLWILLGGGGAILGFLAKVLLGDRKAAKLELKEAKTRGELAAANADRGVLRGEKEALERLSDAQRAEAIRKTAAQREAREAAERARKYAETAAAASPAAASDFLDGVLENPRGGAPRDGGGRGTLRGTTTAPMGARPGKKPGEGA